jgi:ribokinase
MGRVLVAGSINMDVVARATRFPRVGETVPGEAAAFFPGGKGANQAVAAARSGADTALVGRLGDDAFGRELQAFLAAQRIDLRHVTTTARVHTGTAIITVCDGDNTIVVVPGANGAVDAADVGAPTLAAGDVLVSQLEIPAPAIAAFFQRGRAAGARTILNPAPAIAAGRGLLALADIAVLNETELGFFTTSDIGADAALDQVVARVRGLQRDMDQIVCVTLGRRGAIALVDGVVRTVMGRSVAAVDTTGAGDCFVGALAARLAAGAEIGAALEYANVAASICVQRMGAGPSMPTHDEVTSALETTRPRQ